MAVLNRPTSYQNGRLWALSWLTVCSKGGLSDDPRMKWTSLKLEGVGAVGYADCYAPNGTGPMNETLDMFRVGAVASDRGRTCICMCGN